GRESRRSSRIFRRCSPRRPTRSRSSAVAEAAGDGATDFSHAHAECRDGREHARTRPGGQSEWQRRIASGPTCTKAEGRRQEQEAGENEKAARSCETRLPLTF